MMGLEIDRVTVSGSAQVRAGVVRCPSVRVTVILAGAVPVRGIAVAVVLFVARVMRMLVRVTVGMRMAVGRAVRMRMFVGVLVLVFVGVLGHGASEPGSTASLPEPTSAVERLSPVGVTEALWCRPVRCGFPR